MPFYTFNLNHFLFWACKSSGASVEKLTQAYSVDIPEENAFLRSYLI